MRTHSQFGKLLFGVLLLGVPSLAQADVSLPQIFSNHAVLQKAAKVPVWGRAAPGEKVVVTLAGARAEGQAGADGQWQVQLDLRAAGKRPFDLVVQGHNRLTIADVAVGEVWVCSGQSNMALALAGSLKAEQEIPASANPWLRQYNDGRWTPAAPASSGAFTAVGYYFGKNLQKRLDVPVGLICAFQSATAIELWISPEGMDKDPDLKAGKERVLEADRLFKRLGPGRAPQAFPAGMFYENKIQSLFPYALQGVIWYQGEGNTERAWQYRTAFPLMIRDWRAHWGRGDFPFYYCQLPNIMAYRNAPGESQWAELREAQTKTLAVPRTGQAVLIDVGEQDDIHPRNKEVVGERLARIALAETYGKNTVASGPVFQSLTVEGDRLRVHFTHTDGGLVARALPATYQPRSLDVKMAPLPRNRPLSQLEGFAVCGADRHWKWADARIEGDTVVVESAEVRKPVAVRYAWADNPICNLYNVPGLPAGPFRSDDFPLSTVKVRYGL